MVDGIVGLIFRSGVVVVKLVDVVIVDLITDPVVLGFAVHGGLSHSFSHSVTMSFLQ